VTTGVTADELLEAAGVRVVPHWLQNFAQDKAAAPQSGHTRSRGWPHSAQNLPPGGLSTPQFEHSIGFSIDPSDADDGSVGALGVMRVQRTRRPYHR